MSGLVSEQIHHFLCDRAQRLPHCADLLERVLSHGTGLELQVNIQKNLGEPVEGRQNTYTDGIDQWFNFRIPRNARTEPEWDNYMLQWSLARYVDCIGSTGFHWESHQSLWVAFDFDQIAGHAQGIGVTRKELNAVQDAVRDIPWVELRRSTSGGGLHLYIPLENVHVDNHTEHAAIARAVLSLMSDEVSFDFGGKVDVCGSNIWIWADRATPQNQGLALLKPATEKFDQLPKNWRDHIPVVTRERQRVSVRGVAPSREGLFTQLASAYRRVKLDDEHKKIMSDLEALDDYETNWVRDHYLCQTHTLALKEISAKYKGVFETGSRGTTDCNCFMFPAADGAWRVYRFGNSTSEVGTWEQDKSGWTSCWFNHQADLKTASLACEASALKNGGYEYPTLSQALKAAKEITDGLPKDIPDFLLHRKTVMIESSVGTLTIQAVQENSDSQPPGWNSVDKRGYWTFVTKTNQSAILQSGEGEDLDSHIRCLITPQNQPAGWCAMTDHAGWVFKTASSIKTLLQFMGNPKPEAEQLMGRAEYRPWKMVSLPFQPEYPGDRIWNLNAPQLAFIPSAEPGPHPHWDMVFSHIGQSLDSKLGDQPWAANGKEYLQGWFASLIREPHRRLPYLFLYGPENGGKSILHESFALLIKDRIGIVEASRALTSMADFNGELEKSILCYVEEKDISSIRGVYEKIKAVVTAIQLAIRRMRTDVYMVDNFTHWMQCANNATALYQLSGDTRITALYVPLPKKEVPRHIMQQKLMEEAPAFLHTLFDFRLPDPEDRLNIPMIVTDDKLSAQEMNQDLLGLFLAEMTEKREGAREISFKDLFAQFQAWLPSSEKWSKIKVSKNMPVEHRIVAGKGNVRFISDLQWKRIENNG